jgi:hypothetical protein
VAVTSIICVAINAAVPLEVGDDAVHSELIYDVTKHGARAACELKQKSTTN